jgi:hypothetical protein
MPTPYAEPQVADETAWQAMTVAQAAQANAVHALTIATNRAQATKASGSTVAAGGTIVSATITPRATGKFRVSFSCAGSIDAPINVLLDKVVGFTTTKIVSWPTTSSGSWVSLAFVCEFDGFTVGTPVTFKGITTLGDGNLTIGNGVDGIGAAILIEELS